MVKIAENIQILQICKKVLQRVKIDIYTFFRGIFNGNFPYEKSVKFKDFCLEIFYPKNLQQKIG